tara:strand:+ start:219 stop:1097 length:879 start_codon:yes stop_codon:yes gene_type:complete
LLSICIPIYQYDIFDLVNELHLQCKTLNLKFEIICIDDNSDELYKLVNQKIKKIESVHYVELPKNIGRSKIRNLFIEKAKYSSLLFIDCDCSIPKKFIEKYLNNIEKDIVYGGRKHSDFKPDDEKLFLRWKYGICNEDLYIDTRKNNPYLSFRSNNFLIKKNIFSQIHFDESITDYGHEDTMLAVELKKNKIEIFHIENAVTHEGLETNTEFLNQVRISIDNLSSLYKKKKIKANEVKLLGAYQLLNNFRLTNILSYLSKFFVTLCYKKLLKKEPKMIWLDLYKLFYLIKIH